MKFSRSHILSFAIASKDEEGRKIN